VLEQKSHRVYVATALAALVLFSATAGFSNSAAAAELDSFGVEKMYPTKQGGNEWYVDMDDPTSTLANVKNVAFEKNSDGSWHVSARQIRMEAWSPPGEKWQNVEITMYAKMDAGTSSSDLLQMYSRGGHHSSRDPCSGSAYKARLYEDGRAAWTKEVTHPAYAHNRGVVDVTGSLEDRWVGFKAVIYNFVEDGNTYVRMESYIDDNVTDENGNLVIGNNWKLASVVEDRGGWGTGDGDFADSCDRTRDEILAGPGGTGSQNIAAWRSDNIEWSFKYLSAREIDPLQEQLPEPQPVPEPEEPAVPDDSDDTENDWSDRTIIAGQHIPNSDTVAIDSIQMFMQKETNGSGAIEIALAQEGKILAKDTIEADELKDSYTTVTAHFGVKVSGSFDVLVMYEGSADIEVDIDDDTIPGNYFVSGQEYPQRDLDITISYG
jgi:hypothetical protein